jgi:plasmid segregation protein ParM
MSNRILLGLDNGNKCTKTSEGYISESGFTKFDYEPISTNNLLVYEGKFYSIGSNRLCVQMDKTVNQDAFILSLPAIADAIDRAGVEGDVDVIIGVGLPIVNYGIFKKKFREYFLRQNIEFNFNKKDYKVDIVNCKVKYFCLPLYSESFFPFHFTFLYIIYVFSKFAQILDITMLK